MSPTCMMILEHEWSLSLKTEILVTAVTNWKSFVVCICVYGIKTRELQTQLLYYFSKSDNTSNHHHIYKYIVASLLYVNTVYIPKVLKFKQECGLGLCTFLGTCTIECRCALVTSDEFCVPRVLLAWSRHCAAAFCLQAPGKHTDLHYILISGTCSKFPWKNKMSALGICLHQSCSSAYWAYWAYWAYSVLAMFAVKTMFEFLPNNRFVPTKFNEMLCGPDST